MYGMTPAVRRALELYDGPAKLRSQRMAAKPAVNKLTYKYYPSSCPFPDGVCLGCRLSAECGTE